jgi:hypothetical protein
MTDEEINSSIRGHVAFMLERHTVNGKLPKGTETEVQQLFEYLANSTLQMLKMNPPLYKDLSATNQSAGDNLIAAFVEESGKANK